jgi:hypothetical protein
MSKMGSSPGSYLRNRLRAATRQISELGEVGATGLGALRATTLFTKRHPPTSSPPLVLARLFDSDSFAQTKREQREMITSWGFH